LTKVYIAGCSLEVINRHYEKGLIDLAIESVKKLNENLNRSLNPDAIIVANGYAELTNHTSQLATKLSIALGYNVPSFRVENGDASGGLGILTAYSLIKSGIANEVLLIGVEKLSEFPSKYMNDIISTIVNEYNYFAGVTPHSIAALMMKLYMKLYNKDYEYFTEWPILMHSYGVENPYAYLKFNVDKKTIIESQIVSEPLRIFDIGARADGVASVVLVSEDRRNISENLIELKKVVSSNSEIDWKNLELTSLRSARLKVSEELNKIDAFEIHDSYSILAALQLESLGLVEKGKAFERLSEMPAINYSGGLKSRGYPGGATGVYQLAEVFLQLTSLFPGKKAKGAKRGAVVSMDDIGRSSYISILEVI